MKRIGMSCVLTVVLGAGAGAGAAEWVGAAEYGAFEVRNPTESRLAPLVKPHPEFWTQGPFKPAIWVEQDGQWQERPLKSVASGISGVDYIDPEGVTRWACFVPEKKLSVVVRINPDELEGLFYYFHTENEQVNLELMPDLAPLAPGHNRTIHATYRIATTEPERL